MASEEEARVDPDAAGTADDKKTVGATPLVREKPAEAANPAGLPAPRTPRAYPATSEERAERRAKLATKARNRLHTPRSGSPGTPSTVTPTDAARPVVVEAAGDVRRDLASAAPASVATELAVVPDETLPLSETFALSEATERDVEASRDQVHARPRQLRV